MNILRKPFFGLAAISFIALVVCCSPTIKGLSPNASDDEIQNWAKATVTKLVKDSLQSGYTMQIISWEDISVFEDNSNSSENRRIIYSHRGEDNEKEWEALRNGKRLDPSTLAPSVSYADESYALSISQNHKIVGVIVHYREVNETEGEKEVYRYFFVDYNGRLLERGTLYKTY